MNLNKLKQNKKKLFAAAAVLWLLVCMFVTPVFTTVTLTFENDPSWRGGDDCSFPVRANMSLPGMSTIG